MVQRSFRRKVKGVIDGDTFRLFKPIQGSRTVRIAGLNASEKNTFAGKRASNSLRAKISRHTVTIKPVGWSYGRVVGQVFNNRRMLR